MAQALPWLHLRFCSVVEPILGGEDVFGGEASEVGRWHKVWDWVENLVLCFCAEPGVLPPSQDGSSWRWSTRGSSKTAGGSEAGAVGPRRNVCLLCCLCARSPWPNAWGGSSPSKIKIFILRHCAEFSESWAAEREAEDGAAWLEEELTWSITTDRKYLTSAPTFESCFARGSGEGVPNNLVFIIFIGPSCSTFHSRIEAAQLLVVIFSDLIKHWTNVFKPPYDDDCEKGLQTEGNHLQPVKQAELMQMNRLLLHAAADTFQVSFLLPGSLNYSQFYS